MGNWVSPPEARERISAALQAIDAAHQVLRDTPSDLAGNDFRVEVAERLETQERTNRGLMYRIFAEIAEPPD
ncbi:MAG: HNH nuclease, partial [Mycobacterium sp.]|nr:HNH nuclease [Mycobacterium sp.]MBW0019904.1 HNH nuclease [Mycobacterium sp.]